VNGAAQGRFPVLGVCMQHELFIGRQPIFDRDLQVTGYALFHQGAADGEAASHQVAVDALMDIGLDRLVGRYRAHLPVSEGFLASDRPLALPADRVVLEIPGSLTPDAGLIASVEALKARGFTFALTGFSPDPAWEPVLDLVAFAGLDASAPDPARLEKDLARVRRHRVTVLADRVETAQVYERCRALGFDLFRGHFLCRPQIVRGRRVPTAKLAVLKVLAELNDPDTDAAKIEALVSRDVGLTCRLLRYVNAPFFGLSRSVESMRQAVVLLGLDAVRRWATLILLAELSDKPPALMATALVRGRMCESLARSGGEGQPDSFFTVGLLSVLDALADAPMDELLVSLPLAEPIKEALRDQAGPPGRALAAALAYEHGRWDDVRALGLPAGAARAAYVDAVTWADAAGAVFELPV
jgi:EAL and modified HD-GYP domain-containing signal transduction protein